MRSLIYMLGLVALLQLCGCRHDTVRTTLDAAESLMEEHPDSALALLQPIDGSQLRGETQARHALLLSQAYDKNYIDKTDDSLITIAATFYDNSDDIRRRMMSQYYLATIYSNRQDYDRVLSIALDVVGLAEKANDSSYIAKATMLVAQSYLHSSNLDGAEEYLDKTLRLARKSNKPEWVGMTFYNLCNLALRKRECAKALQYVDSARKYTGNSQQLVKLEIYAHIWLRNYRKVDSIYNRYIDLTSDVKSLQAYHILAEAKLGRQVNHLERLALLLPGATTQDSIEIFTAANKISRQNGDYRRALINTDFLMQQTNRLLVNLSRRSLYRIQLEHDKLEAQAIKSDLRNRTRTSILISVIAALIIALAIVTTLLLIRNHKARMLQMENDLARVAAEFNDMQIRQRQEMSSLRGRLNAGQTATLELFMSKYAWVEQLGNIFLDAEAAKPASSRIIKEIKQKLDAVRTRRFIEELIEIINRYRNGLIDRVASGCHQISRSEQEILALLCANLSPRIIAFILDMKQQSVYNAKSSIKRKIERSDPALLTELTDVFK